MLGILVAATVASSPTPPHAAPQLACPATRSQRTTYDGRVGPKKLGDLPDGQLYHAVLKEAGGCSIDEVLENGRWVDRLAGPAHSDRRQAGDRGR
ncbi:MAG TPA: hypothetical protein VGG29_17830 [Caulobacteraceae bacterium]|jgi:hypothetical protein